MALHEEHDPHAKQYWHTRFARERQSISESVEETLADPSSQEQWSDDEQQYVTVDRALSSTELVPPRLSLQSKVQPSVRPASFVQSVTAEIAAQQEGTKEREEYQKPQSTNLLTRLAQRFTSSFAAIVQPSEEPIWMPTRRGQDESFPQERHLAPLPSSYAVAPIESVQMPTVVEAIPATPSQPASPPIKSNQRLAGRTTKVHLQTTPTSKTTPYLREKVHLQTTPTSKTTPYPREDDIYSWSRETNEPLREPLTVNVRFREKVQDVPSTEQSTEIVFGKEIQVQHETNAMRSPSAAYTSFFGTGTFEKEQSELMVRNTHTVATSVVHITLTSNPGPTLVQYISLHPSLGFTLHLTAPVTMKTTFNYVLLVDTSIS